MAKTTELASAQEDFYAALRKSADTVADLRLARTGRRGGTGEWEAAEVSEAMGRMALVPNDPSPPPTKPMKRTPSQIRISAPDVLTSEGVSKTDFNAIIMLINRLKALGDEDTAEIVCLDDGSRIRNGNSKFSCQGIQAFWLRSGKIPPTVRYAVDESLEQAVASRPIAVFICPDRAPVGDVKGYIKVILEDPYVCMFLRRT